MENMNRTKVKDEMKQDDRRVRRTKKILKTSLAKLLLEKKINNITVKELVDLADINRGTFYLHYTDIYNLLEQIEKDMFSELEEMSNEFANSEAKRSPQFFTRQVFQYVADNRDLCKMLLGPYGDMAFVERLKSMVEEKSYFYLMETCSEQDVQSYKYFAAFAVSGCVGLLQNWIENGMKVSVEELSNFADSLIQFGIEKMRENV